MTSYKETAKQVVDKIGGAQNVKQSWHCVTRLRFNLHDKNKVQMEEIKQIKEVMGAQFSGDQFQVIIGNRVAEVFEEAFRAAVVRIEAAFLSGRRGPSTARLRFKASIRLMTFWREGADATLFLWA